MPRMVSKKRSSKRKREQELVRIRITDKQLENLRGKIMVGGYTQDHMRRAGPAPQTENALPQNGMTAKALTHVEALIQQQSEILSLTFRLRDRVQGIADRIYCPQPETKQAENKGPPGGTIGNLQWQLENGMSGLQELEHQISRIEGL